MLRGAATELGISDVGLREVCDSNNIPRPPAGFLQMKELNPDIHQRVREIEKLISESGRVDERGILNQRLRADHHLIRVSRPQLRRASDLLISCLSAMHNLGYPSEFKEERPTDSYRRDQGNIECWVELRDNKSTVKGWVEEFSTRATRPLTPTERNGSTVWFRGRACSMGGGVWGEGLP